MWYLRSGERLTPRYVSPDALPTLGSGGKSEHFTESAYLVFVDDEALYGYAIELHFCKPADELMTIPSLLGRDIIDRWGVTYEKSRRSFLRR